MLNVYSEIEKYIFTALELEAKLIDRENELEKANSRIVELEAELKEKTLNLSEPFLADRGDGVSGHYCIARYKDLINDLSGKGGKVIQYWSDGEWCAFGDVFELKSKKGEE